MAAAGSLGSRLGGGLKPSRDSTAEGKRVAVIAVHGVADQPPDSTVRTIADLLANLATPEGVAYAPFTEQRIDIPVRRVDVPREANAAAPFYDRAPKLRARQQLTIDIGADQPTLHFDAGLEFMSSLLADYRVRGPEETYQTTMLRGSRRAGTHHTGVAVDVYEMYWADLSRLTSNVFRIFGDAYQLLFHVASLGVHVVTAAQSAERTIAGPWRVWAWAQRYAADCLAVYIALLNLLLVALALVLVPQALGDVYVTPAAWTVGGFLVACGAGYAAFRKGTRSVVSWIAPLLIFAVAVAISAYVHGVYETRRVPYAREALMTETLVIVSLLTGVVVALYDAQRPRVGWIAKRFGVLFGGYLLGNIWTSSGDMVTAIFRDVEAVYITLGFAWGLFIVLSWLAFEAGRRVKSAARGTPSYDRVSRAAWTARLTLAVPAALFLITTIIIWFGLWSATNTWLRGYCYVPALLAWLPPASHGDRWIVEFVQALIVNGAAFGFALLVGAAAISAVMSVYALAPIVVTEVFPYKRTVAGARTGVWLDHGFALLRQAGRILVFGVLVLLPAGALLLISTWPVIRLHLPAALKVSEDTLLDWNQAVLMRAAALLVPAAAGLLAFGGRLKSLALGFRNIVDVALDVDNYLRGWPLDAAPRARIAARFASLLRYVYAQPYDAFVIVAHSQGTVITADLLRFIKAARLEDTDAALGARRGRPIRFFTMGSPLRQLYGLRFPHLYQWARHELTDQWTNPNTKIPNDEAPDPKQLDVDVWVNAYRSGDYVGRYLWRPDRCSFVYDVPTGPIAQPWPLDAYDRVVASVTAAPVTRREFCIGAGAHTHYWDRTAPHIAAELDKLIVGTR